MLKVNLILFLCLSLQGCSQKKPQTMNPLSKDEQRIIINKGTEYPNSGQYTSYKAEGTYLCKQCNSPLYYSRDKFESHCGWPSFDDEIKNAVIRKTDADGHRTEIICANCGGHLGHIFEGEGYTIKNTRHCVNSVSLRFIPLYIDYIPQRAIFAAGCFWGVQYYFQNEKGVILTNVGYIGGNKENPTYNEVCSHTSGHFEAIEIFYNPNETNFNKLAKLFFEIHDFTQENGQGPDIGEQYLSRIFYLNDEQKLISDSLIEVLQKKYLYKVATKVVSATVFWNAEEYHQQYYDKNGKVPYCHIRKIIF
jgi:peptide methionine sulfoxide reductase msrA/msrB